MNSSSHASVPFRKASSHRFARPIAQLVTVAALLQACLAPAEIFRLPTANRAIFEPGGEERYFVGTVGKPWTSGTFGCVRTDGWQLHEGLDIRCLQRDARGEPADPVLATADGEVVYLNNHPALSNYGNYLVLRHHIEGLEVYSLYAHLHEIRAGLKPGSPVKSGEVVAVMGRTTNTKQGISKDRAHVHFELNFQVNERFATWYHAANPGERNDHGNWNGQNLLGLDPRLILLAQQKEGAQFSLLNFIRKQTELCHVFVRSTHFPWLKHNPQLVRANPKADAEGVAGYEVALNFNGFPFELIPRAPSEVNARGKFRLLSVNAVEQQKNPCRRLVTQKNGHWELTSHGVQLLELLIY